MGWLSVSLLALTLLLSLADKAVMAPNLDSFGRDRAAYQEHSRQRRIAEREARRYQLVLTFLSLWKCCIVLYFWPQMRSQLQLHRNE